MRFEHWERRLAAAIDKHKRIPHAWGEHDCAVGFVADCVWALTQKYPAAAWRKTYSDEMGARRIIAAHPRLLVGLVEDALSSAGIPFERIAPAFAQRGDVCLVEEGVGSLGICNGSEILGKSLTGFERRPLSAASIVWAIR